MKKGAAMEDDMPLFDKEAGERGRDKGIARVLSPEERAKRVEEVTVRALVLGKFRDISTDDLYEDFARIGIDLQKYLGNAKSLAGVFKGDRWEPVGWVQSKVSRCHARPKRVWRLNTAKKEAN